MKPPEPLEWQIQKAIVDYAKLKWKPWLIFHIPNKHVPHTNTRTTIKAGMVSGVPDLGLVGEGGIIIFIEVKRPSERLKDKQIAIHMCLHDRLIKVATVSSVEQFDEAMSHLTADGFNFYGIGEPHRKSNYYDKAKKRVRSDYIVPRQRP